MYPGDCASSTNTLSCASVVHHNDKVQRVSSEEAITGFNTSSPVSPAFCLSAGAVKPSIFPPSFMDSPSPCVPPLFWLFLYNIPDLLIFTICVCLCVCLCLRGHKGAVGQNIHQLWTATDVSAGSGALRRSGPRPIIQLRA